MASVKVLMVREYFIDGTIDTEQTVTLVWEIQENRELGVGYARIVNETDVVNFKMKVKANPLIKVSSKLSVRQTLFNGRAVNDVCEKPFNLGDVVEVYLPNEEVEDVVQRDTLVLVPNKTPAQMLA